MLTNYLVLDLASAPIADAGSYVEPASAPSNWKDAEKIAAYVAEKTAERVASAALDLDLARITAIGVADDSGVSVQVAKAEEHERTCLDTLRHWVTGTAIVTYGGLRFDLPLALRRARYLQVDFPTLNLDRYRTTHVDLCDLLSDRDPSRRRPLGFYVRRLGWTDLVKPLSGEEESRVIETGRWDDLAASVRHDVVAIHRLAQWLGVIPKVQPAVIEEPVL